MKAWASVIALFVLAGGSCRGADPGATPNASSIPLWDGEPQSVSSSTAPTNLSRFCGVCCFYNAEAGELFLQNEWEAVLVSPPRTALDLGAGQLIEVEGDMAAGTRGMRARTLRLLGEGPLPSAVSADCLRLKSGELQCRYVQFTGVVRTAMRTRPDGTLPLILADPEGRVTALIKNPDVQHCRALVDAVVRVSGVCLVESVGTSRVSSVTVRASGIGGIEVLQPAPSPVFVALDLAAAQWPGGERGLTHRVRAIGTIWSEFEGGMFLLVSGKQAFLASTREPALFRRGDKIQVTGFPGSETNNLPLIEDSVLERVGFEPAPTGVAVNGGTIDAETHFGQLVQLEALVSEDWDPIRAKLLLRSCNALFSARLGSGQAQFPKLGSGTVVRVTGVCVQRKQVGGMGDGGPGLLIASAADVQVLRRPRPIRKMLVGAAVFLLCGAAAAKIARLKCKHGA